MKSTTRQTPATGRQAQAAWVGTWAVIVIANWLPVLWRDIGWLTETRRARQEWRALTTDFASSVAALLEANYIQLRLITFLTAAAALVLAEFMRRQEPRWLAWVTIIGALIALANSLWNPTMFA